MSRLNENKRLEIIANFKYNILPLVKKYPKHIKIIDIGCGSGYNVNELRKLGYNVVGTDISEEMINLCISRYGQFFSKDDIVNTKIRDKFDLIICTETLEHIQDLYKAIENLKTISTDMIITFPYKEELIDDVCPSCNQTFKRSGHLHYFDKEKINSLELNIVSTKITTPTIILNFNPFVDKVVHSLIDLQGKAVLHIKEAKK